MRGGSLILDWILISAIAEAGGGGGGSMCGSRGGGRVK